MRDERGIALNMRHELSNCSSCTNSVYFYQFTQAEAAMFINGSRFGELFIVWPFQVAVLQNTAKNGSKVRYAIAVHLFIFKPQS